MTTEIVNGNQTDDTEIDQWIDRRSKFGNPFKISDFTDFLTKEEARKFVIDLYRNYLEKRVRTDENFKEELYNLKGKTLACHCKPKDCHGDIIKRMVEDETYIQNGKEWKSPDFGPLPEVVECPDCGTETAERDQDDQLFICTECGRETVVIR